MPEITVPCPSCQASLLVDEQNAGQEVLCPGCQARLTLPSELNAKAKAVLSKADAEEPARRNLPLLRTGHMAALPEDAELAAAPAQNRPAHLPERRGLSPEEEMRRLAALTVDPGSFDLHNVDTKGRTAFPCPGCHRPVWIARSDWGRVLVCGGCAREVVAPDPSKGIQAQLASGDQPDQRQKTVLPARRQVENQPVNEPPAAAAARPPRQGSPLPSARTPAREPSGAEQRRVIQVPAVEPIPARGDVEISPTLKKDPPAKRTVIPQEQARAAAEFGDRHPVPLAPSGEMTKPLQRLTPERAPNFTPKHDADLSAEVTGNWGSEAGKGNTAAFRRTLTVAIIVLGLGGILVTGFMLRSYFSPQPHTPVSPEDTESPTKNVDTAKATLTRFFKAGTVDLMAQEVRHPEITLPRMRAWYSRTGISRQAMDFTVDWREQDDWVGSGKNFIFTTLRVDATTLVSAALELPKDGGNPKLDWESFVTWSEIPWSEFLKTTSERPADFRVTITPVDYYNGPYSDRSRYQAFLVKDAANFGSCWAYCDVNSNLGLKLSECVREARKKGQITTPTGGEMEQGVARVILRLHYLPEGKKFNQAAIDALVWNDWLEP